MTKNIPLSEDTLFAALEKWKIENQVPTASLRVKSEGYSYHCMSGYTKLGGGTPISNNSLFEAGSITKTFIAVLIMKLAEDDQLCLEDIVEKYLPQYFKWRNVSIRQLLSMTCRIANYFYDKNFKDQIYNNKGPNYDTNSLLTMAYNSNESLLGNEMWYYSNTNYLILGKILEVVSGCSVLELLNELILNPFSFNNTYYSDTRYPDHVMQHKVHGYYNDLDVTYTLPSNYGATGSMLMNAYDIEHLVNLLFVEEQILKPCSFRKMLEGVDVPYSVGRPVNTRYGLGVFITESDSIGRMIWHTGLMPGYSSSFIYLPNYKLTIVGQINRLQGTKLKISNHDLLFPNGALMQQLLGDITNHVVAV